MKKLILPLAVLFITMSSFTTIEVNKAEEFGYCDDIAEFWYNSALIAGFGQQAATNIYKSNLSNCYLLGGDTDAEVVIAP